MKSKVEFYKAFFEELEKKGFGVGQPSSPDYVVDITQKKKTVAFFTKNDILEKNPFEDVQDKQIARLWEIARATVSLCGICQDKPYEDDKTQNMGNGIMKINEHNGVILACRQHPLYGYVLSTFKQDTENKNKPVQRQYFYNKEEAFQDFAVRSGLVDGRRMFNETELKVLYAGLVKLGMDDQLLQEESETMGGLINRIEEILPEMHKEERRFDFTRILDAFNIGNER